ncbi:MAG: chemotaxis protein CheR, partial [Pseudorhodobacter sp.]|nr:chemotaxis protein CheR [Pseudorhodobacter sp.]
MVVASNRFPIVGIGASAGGIAAMEGLFRGLPADCDMAFVVVTHLSANRESRLHEVVGRYTTLPTVVAENGQTVVPGTVYVMPNNTIMTIAKGRLVLRKPDMNAGTRKPVDIFFSALATDQAEYAVGIVLSGGDSDGTLGIKAIKEHGGLTIAQSADHSGPTTPDMPESAIASGLIDLALPADEMGAKLREFSRSFDLLAELCEADGEKALNGAKPQIYDILHARSGHDFSGYKANTFLRRVRRRMQLADLPLVETYLNHLREDPTEVDSLFRDLLINVTDFFRDTGAFKMLEEVVIPEMLLGRTANDTVRIWVPGCATGEEVYSIGMLMRERLDQMDAPPRVTIFATDIDAPVLGVARAGRYPTTLLENLTPERRERFFITEGSSAVVVKDLREMCVFSPHSVIKDPPFARMDLVSCRNLLIYFGPDVQDRVIPTFHYALKPGGFLFLGTAESVGRHGDLFAPLDGGHRIFRAREHSAARRMSLLMTANDDKSPFGKTPPATQPAPFPLRMVVESLVLARYSPAHVVVNADGDVVYYSANTGRYLEAPQGAPNRQLLSIARRDLRLALRSALR